MKNLFTIAIILIFGTSAFAQNADFGVKLGANFSSISDASRLSNKTGLHFGIFGGFKLSNRTRIQADVLYSQQGAETKDGKFDLNYINVPVVFKYFLFDGLNIQFGPQFGFILDDDIYVLGKKGTVKKSDISAVVGAGYDLPYGFRLDARYNFGLTGVWEFDSTSGKNRVASIALGYSFL